MLTLISKGFWKITYLRVFILTVALLEATYARGCMNTMYSILCRVYDVCFHPTVRTYVRMHDLLARVASRPFSPLLYLASVSAGKICRKSQNYFWSSGVFQQQLGASSGQLRPSPGPQMSHAGPGPSQNQFQSETVRFICIISPEANLCLLEMQLKLSSRNSDNNTGMTFEK